MGAAMHAAVHAAVAPWDIGAQQQESMDSAKAPHQAQAARKVLARCAVQCNDRCACARACMHYASLGALARGSTRTCVCCVCTCLCVPTSTCRVLPGIVLVHPVACILQKVFCGSTSVLFHW